MIARFACSGKLLVLAAGWLTVAGPLSGQTAAARNRTAPQAGISQSDIAGDWQAVIHGEKDVRAIVSVSKAGSGWRAVQYNADEPGGAPVSIPVVTQQGDTVRFTVSLLDGRYEGRVSADGNSIAGTWTAKATVQPLTWLRATKMTAWAIPSSTSLPLMAADADPKFEVTTVKPHDPDTPPGGYRWVQGRHFQTSWTVAQVIQYIYGIEPKQLLNAPDWVEKDIYDLAGFPDTPGRGSQQQKNGMMRKLLEDRFQLKTHIEKRTMSAYVLSVSKDQPKNMSPAAANDPSASMFGRPGPVGGLLIPARSTAMWDLVNLLQSFLDRPVVDQTGLTGRYDFDLIWTPDGWPPSDTAPPGIFTALQEEIGLKLSPATVPVNVVVMDHVERPSPN